MWPTLADVNQTTSSTKEEASCTTFSTQEDVGQASWMTQ